LALLLPDVQAVEACDGHPVGGNWRAEWVVVESAPQQTGGSRYSSAVRNAVVV